MEHSTKVDQNHGNIDCIIKFGGSALTYKDQKEKINETLFESTLNAFVKCWDQNLQNGKSLNCILIHGAGSFGHPHAQAANVQKGLNSVEMTPEQVSKCILGFANTRLGLNKLSIKILDHLIAQKVPVTLTTAFPSWQTNTTYESGVKKSQSVVEEICSTFQRILDIGLIPIIHGDCVLDENQSVAVLSGDLILDTLAEKLRPKYVVYVSDVEGVFDKPPFNSDGSRNQNAKIIPEILIESDSSFVMPETCLKGFDVTGGMAGKLSAAAKTASRGIPVYIVKGGSQDMIEACQGKIPSGGTTLRLKQPHQSI